MLSPWFVGRQDTRKSMSFRAHLRLNTSVLRDAVFRDGHVRLDFQARDDRGLQPFRRRLHLVHHAVDAIPQTKSLGQRFQVNIRRAHLERIDDDLVHQLDQRRIRLHGPALVFDRLNMLPRQRRDDIPEPFVLLQALLFRAIILAQRRLDVRLGRHLMDDFHPQQMIQTVDRIQVGRVREGDGQGVAMLENGNHAIFFRDVTRNRGNDIIRDIDFGKIDHLRAEMRGFGLGDIRRADDFVGEHQIDDANSGGIRFCTQCLDLWGGYKAKVHQHVHQIIVFLCHVRFFCRILLQNGQSKQSSGADGVVKSRVRAMPKKAQFSSLMPQRTTSPEESFFTRTHFSSAYS